MMKGTVLLNRYVLEELIGTGGMATVYRAKDNLSKTTVAIKILKTEYNNDLEFVRRFQREAIAAQTMLHPNIVKVMDVGEWDGLKFIVMEYVDGVTLKDLIEKNGAIPAQRAIDYAIQIARAMEHAHRCHIIHRDIKSQNIMVDKRGIIKVGDFGIARATNSATVTISDEGILGSVHYFSPEQASGDVADEKSDIYSLGVVVYEMVTGKLPFDGETPVSVALKHIQTPPVPPKNLNPGIPAALNDVILKAMRKNRNIRYKSAIAMELDLSMALTHPEGGYVIAAEDTLPETAVPEEDPETEDDGEEEDFERPVRRTRGSYPGRKKKLFLLTGASLLAVAIIIAMALWFWENVINTNTFDALIGMSGEEAVSYLAGEGYESVIVPAYSDTVPRGMVIAHSAASVQNGVRVILEISGGPQYPFVAELAGMTVTQANGALYAQGLSLGEVVYSHTASGYNEGEIFMQSPAARSKASNGDKVIVYVYRALKEKEVPKVVGFTLESAEAALKVFGFKLGEITKIEASDVPEGTVISQDPAEGEMIMEGTPINVAVASPVPVFVAEAVEFTVDVPSGGGTLIVYQNVGGSSIELLRENCLPGAKNYTIAPESETGGKGEIIVYLNNTRIYTFEVNFRAAALP